VARILTHLDSFAKHISNVFLYFFYYGKAGPPTRPSYFRDNPSGPTGPGGGGMLPTQRPKASKFSKRFPSDSNPGGRVRRRVGVAIGHCPLDSNVFLYNWMKPHLFKPPQKKSFLKKMVPPPHFNSLCPTSYNRHKVLCYGSKLKKIT